MHFILVLWFCFIEFLQHSHAFFGILGFRGGPRVGSGDILWNVILWRVMLGWKCGPMWIHVSPYCSRSGAFNENAMLGWSHEVIALARKACSSVAFCNYCRVLQAICCKSCFGKKVNFKKVCDASFRPNPPKLSWVPGPPKLMWGFGMFVVIGSRRPKNAFCTKEL